MLDSYVEIDLDKIGANARAITQKYSDYKYFIAVLKGDGYGHGMEVANEMYKTALTILPCPLLRRLKAFVRSTRTLRFCACIRFIFRELRRQRGLISPLP